MYPSAWYGVEGRFVSARTYSLCFSLIISSNRTHIYRVHMPSRKCRCCKTLLNNVDAYALEDSIVCHLYYGQCGTEFQMLQHAEMLTLPQQDRLAIFKKDIAKERKSNTEEQTEYKERKWHALFSVLFPEWCHTPPSPCLCCVQLNLRALQWLTF